jgi:hypothetical protein
LCQSLPVTVFIFATRSGEYGKSTMSLPGPPGLIRIGSM